MPTAVDRNALLPLLILGVAVFLAYGNSLGNEFVYDDLFVVPTPLQTSDSPLDHLRIGIAGKGHYRPLRTFSYAIDRLLGGHRPSVYRFGNLVYHWLAALLVYLVARRLLSSASPASSASSPTDFVGAPAGLALAAALLWTLHPVQTESVAYISGRRDLLAGLFTLLGFYAFLRFREAHCTRPAAWLALTFLAFVLGVLSKEAAIILPLLLMAYDLSYRHRGSFASRLRRLGRDGLLHAALLGVAVLALMYYVTFVGVRFEWHGGTQLANFATVPRIWVFYLRLICLPVTLNADYSGAFPISHSFLEPGALLSALFVGGVAAVSLAGLGRFHPLPIFASLWFMVTLLPVSHILPHPEMVAEHYLYLPSFGFCLLLAWLLERSIRNRALRRFLLFLLLIAYAGRTVVRNRDWRDEETLWSKTVATAPTSARARHNLGVTLQDRGDLEGAERSYLRAAELDPRFAYPHAAMAEVHLLRQEYDAAVRWALSATELSPDWARAHFVLAFAYSRLRKEEQAIAALRRTLELRPGFFEAYPIFGELLREARSRDFVDP